MRILRLGRREHSEDQPVVDGPPVAGRKYVFKEGDSLRNIAVSAYGDPQYADDIAHRNGLAEGQVPKAGDVLDLPKRRKLFFGERISPKLLIPGLPFVAGSGLGAHEVLAGGNDAKPVKAGGDEKAIVQAAPERMSLQEALASQGFAFRLLPSDGIAQPSPRQIKKAERLLKSLGFRPGKIDTRLTTQSRIAITEFQLAVGIEANGELTDQTLRKLETTSNRVKKRGKGYLTQGMKGPEIKKLQERLQRLGDFEGTPDGIYGASTAAAVLKFRARHKSLDNGIRSWSSKCQKVLNQELANIAHDPYRERVKPSKQRTALDRKAEREARTNGIGPGSPPEVIKYVKEHLARAGYNPNSTGPVWTDHTQAMMEQFLRRAFPNQELPESPRLTLRGWKKLSKSTIETNSRFEPIMRVGERSHAVLHLERDLKRAGQSIEPDRLYTENTEKKVDNLRRHFGIRGKDGAGVGTHRLVHKRIRQQKEAQKKTVKGCARILLRSNNVSFWTGLSTGSDVRALRQLARTGKAYVPVTGQYIRPNLRLMQALVDMAEHGPIQITALTGGVHSTNSNHYRGTAVDLSIFVGDPGEIERIANRHGGFRNFETDHIHLDF